MGAWDTGPRENDTALDHELHIFGCDGRDDIGPQEPDEWRYVAWLLTQLDPNFPRLKDRVDQSLKRLNQLLDDHEWLDRWNDPEAIEASIRGQIEELEKIMTRPGEFDALGVDGEPVPELAPSLRELGQVKKRRGELQGTMKTIKLPVYDIEIDIDGLGNGAIRAGLRTVCPHCNKSECFFDCDESQAEGSQESETEARERLERNRAYDGIESLILALACTRVMDEDSMTTPAFLEAVENAVEAVENNIGA